MKILELIKILFDIYDDCGNLDVFKNHSSCFREATIFKKDNSPKSVGKPKEWIEI